MRRFQSLKAIAFLAVVLVFTGGNARSLGAQGTLQNSTIFGTITDSSGASISGASVDKVTFGIDYQLVAGAPNYTTDQITGVPNLGTVTIPVNQYGNDRNAAQNIMNLRFGRIFPIKEHDTLELTLELFNALDVAPGTTVNYINGSMAPGSTKAFGFTSVYVAPMVGRIGATFKF